MANAAMGQCSDKAQAGIAMTQVHTPWLGGRPLGCSELLQWQQEDAGGSVVNAGLRRAGHWHSHTLALTLLLLTIACLPLVCQPCCS